MIFDTTDRLERYNMPQEKFSHLVKFIQSFDSSSFQAGRFEIDGDELFGIGLEYKTKSQEECLWEAHRKYIDVHYIIEGEEIIYINDISDMKETKSYDLENDYTLFEGMKKDAVVMQEKSVLILYPNEIHKTSIALNEAKSVRKIVFKLKL